MKKLKLALAIAALLAGCTKEHIAPTPPAIIRASPEQIYNHALESLKPVLAPNTRIQREDDTGNLTFRFTAQVSPQDPIRLIEVVIIRKTEAESSVSVRSKRFSFTRTADRDQSDTELEERVKLILLEKYR